MKEVQDVPQEAITLRPGHADAITRLNILIAYQAQVLTSLQGELRQFILVAYGIDIATQQVVFDKDAEVLRPSSTEEK